MFSRSKNILALIVVLVAAAVVAPGASAAKVSVKIVSPQANSTVSGSVSVKAKVKPAKRSHQLRFYIDDKLRSTMRFSRKAGTSRAKKLSLKKVSAGEHTIRVVVRTGKRSATSSVKVNVTESVSITKKPTADPGTAPASFEPIPKGNTKNFRLIFADDFTKDAALGTLGSDSDANKIVYTGETGTRWRTYPKTYKDTYHKRPYRSDKVLSVKDGVMDFWLHNVDGQPAGANPSPVIKGDSQYQTYGRYSARIKVDSTDLDDYYMAWLLWPQEESSWASAESDYPEGALNAGKNGVQGFHHYAPGQQEWIHDETVDIHDWHTYTQEWEPGIRRYYVDNRLIHTTIKPVWEGPQRWQLQTETIGSGTDNGHLQVDWVAVYEWAPGVTG